MLKRTKSKSMNRRTPLDGVSNARNPKENFPSDRHIDRLLLVRSELSALVNQLDQIFANAFEHNVKSEAANMDTESLIKLLSAMNSSLKPWVQKLSQAQATSTPAVQFSKSLGRIRSSMHRDRNSSPSGEPELGMTISPSPLVAWRTGCCGIVTEKHLFLLTPLSKPRERSKLKARNLDKRDNLSKIVEEPDVPKTCIVEESNRMKLSASLAPISFDSSPRDPKLLGNGRVTDNALYSSANGRRDAGEEEALEWFLSPPKTCTLMDPGNATKNPSAVKGSSLGINNPEISISMDIADRSSISKPCDGIYNENDQELHDFLLCNITNKGDSDEELEWFLSPPKTCALMEPLEGLTPVLGDLVLKSGRAGETTLKRELWTKFQAVSIGRVPFKDSALPEAEKKGFLDMLEEASF